MPRRIRFPLLVLPVCLLSCGGGGGGDSAFFGGVYRGVITIDENPCAIALTGNGLVDWTVNQDATRIVLDSSGTTYEGAPTGSSSFAVTRADPQSSGCLVTTDISISSIQSDSAEANFTILSSCLPECAVKGSGSLSRSTGNSRALADLPTRDILTEVATGLETSAGVVAAPR
jgi:hypothetical protein